MNASFHLGRTWRRVAYPLVQLRDRILFSDHPLMRQSRWSVQRAPQTLNDRPFFIVGNPRSGTTLLRAILSQHHDVFIPPENGALGQMIRTFGTYRAHPWRDVVAAVLEEFRQGYEFQHWCIDLDDVKQAAASLPVEERTLAGLIHLLYRTCGALHAPGKTQWGDKTVPNNAAYLGKIDLVFPQSRYIHIVRDGRDCVVSVVKAGFCQDYAHAAYIWKDTVRKCHRFGRKLRSQNRFFELRYEDLIASPKQAISALCRFLDLEPTEAMLHYGGEIDQLADVHTIAHHKNVTRPIFRDSIGSWTHQLPKSALPAVLKIIRKDLDVFGYE